MATKIIYIHTHAYGVDANVVSMSDKAYDLFKVQSDEVKAAACGCDFEPDNEEFFETTVLDKPEGISIRAIKKAITSASNDDDDDDDDD